MATESVTDVEEIDAQQIIGDLARAHRTPRSVEQFGIEAVPKSLRTARWHDISLIWFATVMNPALIMLPGMAVVNGGLSFWEVILASAAGAFLGSLPAVVLCTFGPETGLPGQMLVRSVFGITGTRTFVSILRVLTCSFWFALQTLSGALGIQAMLAVLAGVKLDLLSLSLLLGIVQATFALLGFGMIRNAGRILTPVALFVSATMLYVFLTAGGAPFAPERVLAQSVRFDNWLPIMLWAGTIFGIWMPTSVSSSDMTRYGRSRLHGWIGTAIGLTLGTTASAVVGTYGTVASGDWNPFSVAAQLAHGVLAMLILGGLVVSLLVCNTVNLYAAGLSLVNAAPRLGRFWATLSAAVLSIGACLFPVLVFNAQGFIGELGRVFAPIAGVLVADYLVIKRCRVDLDGLLGGNGRYRYWHDVNWVALLAAVIGYAVNGVLPQWLLPALTSGVFTGIVYVLMMLVVSCVSTAYREAIRPNQTFSPSRTP